MMPGYHGHMSGWNWFGMSVGMVVFWGLLIALTVVAVRALIGGDSNAGRREGTADPDPGQILAERYARGEIDEDEYRRRLSILSGSGPDAARPAPR